MESRLSTAEYESFSPPLPQMSFAKLSFISGPSNRSDLRTGKQSSGEIFFERTNSFRIQKRFQGLKVAVASEANGTLERGGGELITHN